MHDKKAYHQLSLAWGVYPVMASMQYTTDDILSNGIQVAKDTGLVKSGDTVIITGGSAIGSGITDMFQIHTIK